MLSTIQFFRNRCHIFCKRDPSEYTLLLVFTYVHFQQTKVLESLVTYIEYGIIAYFLQFQQCSVLEFVVKHIAYHCLCFIVLCTFESVVLVNHFPQTLQADEDVERGAQGDESAVGPSFFVRTLLTGLHIFISLVTNDNFQLRTCAHEFYRFDRSLIKPSGRAYFVCSVRGCKAR